MNNKAVLKIVYGIAIAISLYLIFFYGRLTIPSLFIGAMEGDPMLIYNSLLLIGEILIIMVIGTVNYFFYKRLYTPMVTNKNPFTHIIYFVIVISIFTFLSIFALQVVGGIRIN